MYWTKTSFAKTSLSLQPALQTLSSLEQQLQLETLQQDGVFANVSAIQMTAKEKVNNWCTLRVRGHNITRKVPGSTTTAIVKQLTFHQRSSPSTCWLFTHVLSFFGEISKHAAQQRSDPQGRCYLFDKCEESSTFHLLHWSDLIKPA